MSDPAKYLDEALALAMRGLGRVSPNPLVGAVVVRNGRIVGRGFHQQHGGPHAEVFALKEAGEKARGATLYCTLEPCNHHGKTPPCTQAVIDAGIAQVVLGARDPNPKAAGGIETLRAAGIDVVTGIQEERCTALNAPFFKTVSEGLPYVTLKWAMTLDGKIATATGDSKWITTEAARDHAHRLRACHDAVLVGVGTVLADNPRLDVRASGIELGRFQPRRVILDSKARTPLNAALWDVAGAGSVTLIVTPEAPAQRVEALRNRGAAVMSCPTNASRIDLREMLRTLSGLGVNSVFVEGGSTVLGAFADAQLIDALRIFVAPRLAGGSRSLPPLGGAGIEKMADALKINNLRLIQTFDGDLFLGGETGRRWALEDLANFCTLQTSD